MKIEILMDYIAVGDKCWGRGSTRAEAIAAMKKKWRKMPKTGDFAVWKAPIESVVNESGGIVTPPHLPAPTLVSRGTTQLWRM